MRATGLAAAVAGALGGVAFLLTMALDMAATGRRTDDRRLLGRLVPGAGTHWRLAGTLWHMGNAVALGLVYARIAPRLPGPGWLRGLLFAQVENLLLWPLIMLLDRQHPDIRSGALPRYHRPLPFAQETLRHATYGLTLGAAYARLTRDDPTRSDAGTADAGLR